MITSLIVIATCVALVAVAIALVECPGYKDGGARGSADHADALDALLTYVNSVARRID